MTVNLLIERTIIIIINCVGTDGDGDEPLWGQMGMKCVGTDTDGDETL